MFDIRHPDVFFLSISTLANLGALTQSLDVVANSRRLCVNGWSLFYDNELAPDSGSVVANRTCVALVTLRTVCLVRLTFAMGCLLLPSDHVMVGGCKLGVLAATILWCLLFPFHGTAADQFSIIVFTSLLLGHYAQSGWAKDSVLWYLFAQLSLCYSSNGIAKVFSSEWRSGVAIQQALSTGIHGQKAVSVACRSRPTMARYLGYAIVAGEALFPLIILCPTSIVILFLAIGVLGHIMVACVMKLSYFVCYFCAAYPAVLFCHLWAANAFDETSAINITMVASEAVFLLKPLN